MKLDIETTPTAMRPAFVAPTLGGSVAGVCPQAGFRRVDDAHTQVDFPSYDQAWIGASADAAGMATGYRPWSPLIT